MDLDAAADRLYSGAPSEFMATRTALVAEAKAAGDGALARQIGALHKPTTAAWALNLLAYEHERSVTDLLEVGRALSAAQRTRDGAALRELSRERHALVDSLVRTALTLADRTATSARDALPTEIRETLEAATGDAAVADELRAGRLTTAHRPAAVGFGEAGIFLVPSTKGEPRNARADAAERRLAEAEDAVQQAESALAGAEREVDRQRQRLTEVEDQLAELAEQRRTLRAEQASVAKAQARAEREQEKRSAAAAGARQQLTAAKQAVRRAR